VRIAATAPSLYFFDPAALAAGVSGLYRDSDEWPGRGEGRLWERGDPVLHIELRRWADLLLIAPLDANTLAKLAAGLSDNLLTCVYRAWDFTRPIVLAPAMNTLMWENPLTRRHLAALLADHSLGDAAAAPPCAGPAELIERINRTCPRLRIVPPVTKTLACGDTGVGAMAAVEDIVQAAGAMRSER
jgi:phosphopantothenoylcysteine decarboxylase